MYSVINKSDFGNTPKCETQVNCSTERLGCKPIALSVNPYHRNKTVSHPRFFRDSFLKRTTSIKGLAAAVKSGFAWSCATYKDGKRSKANFIQAQLIGIDIDDGLSLEEALSHPFVKKYGKLIYTSASHQKEKDGKPACDRFRIVFQVSEPITDQDTYEALTLAVMSNIVAADKACKDCSRYWAGNSKAEIFFLDGEDLHLEMIQEAEAKANEEQQAIEVTQEEQQRILETINPDIIKETVKDILLRKKLIPPRTPGSGTYQESRNICFAIATIFPRDEAIAIAEAWSPPQKGWEPAKIIDAEIRNKGRKQKRVTVFTLLKYATDRGYQLPLELQKAKKDLEKEREKRRKNWESTKKFTPDILVDNKPFFEMEAPKEGTITLVKAPMGSGKTWQVRQWFKDDLKDYSAINLGYRNTLLLQFVADTDRDNEGDYQRQFKHLHRDSGEINWIADIVRITLCIESLEHLPFDFFDDKILLLDEVVSVIKTLLFSSTVKNRGRKIELFCEAVRRSDRVLCFDGNLSDMYCEFLAAIAPNKKIIKVGAKNLAEKPPLTLLQGTLTEDDILKDRDYSLWIYELFYNAQIPAVCADSQVMLEALDKYFQSQGKTGIRIDSTTINDDAVKAFLNDPDNWIKENKPQYLLFSPSAESGLSIDIKGYFTHLYAFLFNQLDCDSTTQMPIRIRDIDLPRFLWATPYRIENNPESIRSPLADMLDYYHNQLITRNINECLSGNLDSAAELLKYIQDAKTQPTYELATRIKAMRNYESGNFRECLYWMLEQQGWDVSNRVINENLETLEAGKTLSKGKKEVKKQHAKDIFNASNKYIGKPDTLLNFDAPQGDKCALRKAKLIDKLPGIQLEKIWNEEFVYQVEFEYPHLLKQLEDRYFLLNPEKSLRKAQEIIHNQLKKARQGETLTPWLIKAQHLRIATLKKVGLMDFIQAVLGERLTADSEAVQHLIKICKEKAIWQALGKKPGHDPIKYTRWLLNQIGYDLIQEIAKVNGKTERFYLVTSYPKKLGHLIQPIMAAIARKHEIDKPILNWEKSSTVEERQNASNDQKADSNFFEISTPETLTTYGLDTVTDVQKNTIYKGNICNQSNEHQESSTEQKDLDFHDWTKSSTDDERQNASNDQKGDSNFFEKSSSETLTPHGLDTVTDVQKNTIYKGNICNHFSEPKNSSTPDMDDEQKELEFHGWHVGDRCWLLHPFRKDWGLARVEKIAPGQNGFMYVAMEGEASSFGLMVTEGKLPLVCRLDAERPAFYRVG